MLFCSTLNPFSQNILFIGCDNVPKIMVICLDLIKHVSLGSNFQNGLDHPCSSTSFYSKSKILEGCQKMLICYVFNLRAFLLKIDLFEAVIFFLNLHWSKQTIFSMVFQIYNIQGFDDAFCPVVVMITKKMPFSYIHGNHF